ESNEQQEEEKDEASEPEKQETSSFALQFQLKEKSFIFIGLAIAAIVFGLFRSRRLLAKRWILYRLQKKPFGSHFTEWYTGLLSILKWHGFTRKPEQTLREFARQMDERLATDSMSILTKAYEEMIYSKRKPNEANEELRTNWFKVLEKLSNI